MENQERIDLQRRRFVLTLVGGGALCIEANDLAGAAAETAGEPLPKSVAGIVLPDSALATAAIDLSRSAAPRFLFNHCMRTYLFGAMLAERDRVAYDAEMIFIASALHDLGLLRRYATPQRSFQMDGADAAKAFLAERGVPDSRAELVWNAIALHTSMLAMHQPPQISLVGEGAGVDVFGSSLDTLAADRVRAVLGAFPRLGFNTAFRDLLVDHCHRKPFAQSGEWLEVFCRAHNPGVKYPDLEQRLLSAHVGS